MRLQTNSPWAPKPSILASLWNVPLQEAKETSPARGARSPRRPERRTWEAGVPPPGACGQRPALHSPVRSPRRGGARGVGSCGAPHASSRTPTSLGRSRRRQLGREPSPRALPRGREGSAARPAKRAGTPALRSAGPGAPPRPRPFLCLRATGSGYRAGDSNRCSHWGCRYHRRPPANASRTDAVIGRAAAALGLWSRRALSHSRTRPGSAPCWRTRVTPPSRHVMSRGGGDEDASPAGPASAAREQLSTPGSGGVLSRPKTPLHTLGRSREANPPSRSAPVEPRPLGPVVQGPS